MELGLLLAGGGGLPVNDLADLARRGEAAGFGGMYVPESWRSGFVPVAAVAHATSHVKVGPYVLNAHARTPLAAGMSAVDLDQLASGRLVLGVGSGNHVMNESGHGVPVVRPLAKMRDYVEVVRQITRAPIGEPVNHSGSIHSITDWKPQADPLRASIPVLLAATAPRMMELAAEVADGIALGALQSAEFVDEISGRARERSPLGDDFDVHCAAMVAVDDDGDRARGRARRAVVDLFALKPHPHYERLLRLQGHSEVADNLLASIAAHDLEGAAAALPDEVVTSLVVAGTPAECAAQVARFETSVDTLVLVNVAAMQQVSAGVPAPTTSHELVGSYDSLFTLARAVRNGAEHVA